MAKGARPGGGGGVTVNFKNGVSINYIQHNGQIYDADTLNPLPTTRRMTLSDIARNAQKAGYGVEVRTPAQERARVEARRKENAEKPDYQYGLGPGGGTSRAARRTARNNRLTTRVAKRRR